MEMTHQRGSSGDVQHLADRILAEGGVRLGRVVMIQPRLDKAPLEGILNEGDDSGSMSVRVNRVAFDPFAGRPLIP